MRFLHAADIHLGRRRLDGRLPDGDLADAFRWIAERAVEEKVDALLLAGDLFDRPQVEPPHLRQAQQVLVRLKDAGIPVIAIEGNHDRSSLNSTAQTWLDYLAHDNLLILLKPRFDADGAVLAPWSAASRTGTWIELKGVRFTGAGYLGAATPHKVRQIVDRLPRGQANVLLLHAGPDYFVGEGGGFSKDDLEEIHGRVSYLALGHIHCPMLHGGWACNPGSPENCGLDESRYDTDKEGKPQPRGCALVEIDPAAPAEPVLLRILNTPRRPVLALTLDATPFGNKLKDGPQALEAAAAKLIRAAAAPHRAVIDLKVSGKVNLNRLAFEPQDLGDRLAAATGVAAVSVNLADINLGTVSATAPQPDILPRRELELDALRRLIAEDTRPLPGLDGDAESLVSLFHRLKELVETGQEGELMAETVRMSPLVEKIRAARATALPEEPAAGRDQPELFAI